MDISVSDWEPEDIDRCVVVLWVKGTEQTAPSLRVYEECYGKRHGVVLNGHPTSFAEYGDYLGEAVQRLDDWWKCQS